MSFRKLTDFIQADVIVALIIDELRARNVAQFIVDAQSASSLGKGSSYKIPGIVDLTVNAYDGTAVTPENVTSKNATILMNKYPFINFYLEDSDVDEASAMPLAIEFARRAAEQIASTIDVDVLGAIEAGATTNSGVLGVTTSPITVSTATNALDYVEDFATVLREANIETNSVIVLPSYVGVKVARELGVNVNNERIAGEGIEMGYISALFGYDVYTSNNLPTGVAGGLASGEYAAIGGKREDFHLIEGLTIVKAGDAETKPATWNQFGQVYGRDFSNAAGWYTGVVTKS